MATDIVELSDAIIERITPVLPELLIGPADPPWNTSFFEPEPVELPAICVVPETTMFVDYTVVPPRWSLRVGFYRSPTDQETARRFFTGLTNRKGPIITRLEDRLDDITDDSLYRLCRGAVQVTNGKGWGVRRRPRQRFLYADIGVDLRAA